MRFQECEGGPRCRCPVRTPCLQRLYCLGCRQNIPSQHTYGDECSQPRELPTSEIDWLEQ